MNIGDSVTLTEEPGSPSGCVVDIERDKTLVVSISIRLIRPVLRHSYVVVNRDGTVTYHTRH